MFKKIDIYYKDSKGKIHYLHSTNSFKYLYLAVQHTRNMYILYKEIYIADNKKVGERINTKNIFAKIDKQWKKLS